MFKYLGRQRHVVGAGHRDLQIGNLDEICVGHHSFFDCSVPFGGSSEAVAGGFGAAGFDGLSNL